MRADAANAWSVCDTHASHVGLERDPTATRDEWKGELFGETFRMACEGKGEDRAPVD